MKGNRRAIGQRLVQRREHVWRTLGDVALRQRDLVMVGAQALGDDACALGLVDRAGVIADGEGLQSLRGRFGGNRGDERRVDASAEKDADGHVGDHARAHRLREQLLGLRRDRLKGLAASHRLLRRLPPAALLADTFASPPAQQAPGSELAHAADDRARTRHVGEHEEGVDRVGIELAQLRLDREQRGQFRGEQQLAVVLVQEQRLLAETVARDQQAAGALIPEGEGEHALQRVHHRLAVLLVEVHQHLGVAAGRKAVAAAPQVFAQLRVVVDLAVEGGPDRAVLVAQRLVTAVDVHDRKAPRADRHAGGLICVNPLVVGPAVAQRRAHRAHGAPVGVRRTPCNSAHSGKHR